MNINDTPQKYGFISKLLHWGIGFLILFQFLKIFERWNEKQNFISSILPPWHGSIGTILMGLILIRILWMIIQWNKRETANFAVKTGHLALYLFMLLAPLSALSLSLSKGRPISVFGLQIIEKGEPMANLAWFGQLHSPIALILIALVIGHAFMAFYHQFKKNGEPVLQKML